MSKQYSRRSFLYGAAACGALSAWGSYLFSAPPQPSPPRQRVLLRIASGVDPTGGRQAVLDMWNATHPDSPAEFVPVGGSTPDQRTRMQDYAESGTVAIVNLDVIHVAQFAAKDWVVPVNPENPNGFLRPLAKTCRKPGDDQTYYAVPFNTDCGVLFHRKIIDDQPVEDAPPLPTLATLLKQKSDPKARWIAQLPSRSKVVGEALVCNVIEHALAANETILTADGTPSYVPGDWTRALQPLQQAISRGRVLGVREDSDEDSSVLDFRLGRADIMRNWPVKFRNLEASRRGSSQAWKVEVSGLPYSVLGGQNLAVVRKFSHQAEAAALINFLTGLPAQRVLAAYGFVPTRTETYNESGVRAFVPHMKKLRSIVEEARPRPITVTYERCSEILQKHARAFLFDGKDFTDEFATELRKSIEG